jgi:two-component system cell cycle sensor histidine kinase/response regulator CckA
LRVLVVEDSEADTELLGLQLKRSGFDVVLRRVETREGMAKALDEAAWDIILCDYNLPQFGALPALELAAARELDTPFIILSGVVSEETAVEAMRAGARDFVPKDKLVRLGPIIERELRESAARAERRGVQEQLRHAQKMDAVGRLAGGVAHDFNNLLSVILTFSELRLRELPVGDPVREDLEEIRKAGERAAALTRQLLAFSRQQTVELQPVDLNDVVRNIDKMLRRLIGEHIDLVTVMADDLALAKADPGHLEQVLVNLAVNARDAMPAGGRLTIETANVVLDRAYGQTHLASHPGPHVMMAVSDTGVGMDRQIQERIFEPFFTTKAQGRGTGLGLSTVFGIVQQLGGSIWVYSEPGHGSTFKVYLPQTLDVAAPHTEQGAQVHRGDETILLVEDEEQVRKVARGILQRSGYHVLEAAGASEALALCQGHAGAIELLLTDVVMPQMSGPKLAERVLEARPGIKVLYMSGYTDETITPHGVSIARHAFVQKPLTPDMLSRKVREVLTRPA